MNLVQRVPRTVILFIGGLLLLPSLASAHPSYAPHVHGSGSLTSAESFIVISVLFFLLLAAVALAFFAQSKKF